MSRTNDTTGEAASNKKRKADITDSPTVTAPSSKKARREPASPVVNASGVSVLGKTTRRTSVTLPITAVAQETGQDLGKADKKAEKKKRRKAQQSEQKPGDDASNDSLDGPADDSRALAVRPDNDNDDDDDDDHEAKEQKRQRRTEKKARRALQKADNAEALGTADLDKQLQTLDTDALASRVDAEVQVLGLPVRNWRLSSATGGRYISQDPVFARDSVTGADFLILATSREVQILDLETSLVVRRCGIRDGLKIKNFVLVGTNIIRIVCVEGETFEWDWTSDSASLKSVAIAGKGQTKAIACSSDGELWYLQHAGKSDLIGNAKPQHMTERRLASLLVLGQDSAEFIVAHGATTVVVGMCKDVSKEKREYIWLELPFQSTITCLDARLSYDDTLATTPKASASKRRPAPHLSLAIGQPEGQIHLYTDMSSLFALKSSSTPISSPDSLPAPRVLHWHRTSPSTIKFSPDGNYLVSGGAETVLVLWQLATGKQQFLPHLGAEVQQLGISKAGDRYAVLLGDNSVIVLSSGELKAVAQIGGLQVTGAMSPEWSRKDKVVEASVERKSVAAIMHPLHSTQVLLSVPSTQPKAATEAALARPWIQTFDFRSDRHIGRQALARTSITDFNRGPEGEGIVDPDLELLAVCTSDVANQGKEAWLASVDSWMPSERDVERYATEIDGAREETGSVHAQRLARREVSLKFWRWDEKVQVGGAWGLNTKVSGPHVRTSGDAGEALLGDGKVLALLSTPSASRGAGFVTVGGDGVVKFWRTKSRKEGGVKWVCGRSVRLPGIGAQKDRMDSPLADEEGTTDIVVHDEVKRPAGTPLRAPKANMAYSQDSSLLVVAWHAPSRHQGILLHFIDAQTAAIRSTKPAVHLLGSIATVADDGGEHEIEHLGLLDRHLILVSDSTAVVWDLVSDELVRRYRIPVRSASSKGKVAETTATLLEVNATDGTFAVAVGGEVSVYAINEKKAVYQGGGNWDAAIVTLLPGTGGRGFVVVYEDATTRDLMAPQSSRTTISLATGNEITVVDEEADDANAMAIDDISSTTTLALPTTDTQSLDLTSTLLARKTEDEDTAMASLEHDRPVVRPEQLAAIFDTEHSHAMMPVKEMFERVLGLFVGGRVAVVGEVGA
ncbi:NET1-associated nuclear protein 1 [Recurvomyces mirabilis]|uniref:NET1-associated nuclear protein 1 n=1 Tax=Recurvomyces mirabilis TaxID=574656 RepID=A0AAE0WWB1_9PEZI|nr:NET1-associated nuclear protein 1 [Recurvomyces mirabilis]KAK5158660.1 NET1-associated nuclear protein 1 [Recurvomyces mirabilis]